MLIETRTPEFWKHARPADFKSIFANATAAGKLAADGCQLMPLAFRDMNAGHVFTIPDACGFAWVTIRDARSRAAKYAIKVLGAKTGNYGSGPGATLWISDYDQSYSRKSAYARAFAETLRNAGIVAYAGDRLD